VHLDPSVYDQGSPSSLFFIWNYTVKSTSYADQSSFSSTATLPSAHRSTTASLLAKYICAAYKIINKNPKITIGTRSQRTVVYTQVRFQPTILALSNALDANRDENIPFQNKPAYVFPHCPSQSPAVSCKQLVPWYTKTSCYTHSRLRISDISLRVCVAGLRTILRMQVCRGTLYLRRRWQTCRELVCGRCALAKLVTCDC
jgi:hypothetical protein